MLGSSDANSDPAQVVKVKSVINGGYAKNLRFPFDDDIGLVFLSECVPIIPGQIETIKLATPLIDSHITTTCTSVTSTGYGRHQNLPKELYVSDGKLRVIHDTVHSFETCKAANKDAMGETFGVPESILNDMLVPEKHFCAGGDTIWSTCNGDSGGPVVLNLAEGKSKPVQVGVTSFGPTGFCGISPDYSTRVSNYGSWISQAVSSINMCPGWTVERMFEGTGGPAPVPITSRCPAGDWQCPSSGDCIELSQVCDGVPDCKDKQDEDTHFCRMSILGHSETPLVGAANNLAESQEVIPPLLEEIKREFKALVPPHQTNDLVGGIYEIPSYVIIGLIQAVSQFSITRSMSVVARMEPKTSSVCATPEYSRSLQRTLQETCKDSLSLIEAAIGTHKSSNLDDLSQIVEVCRGFEECVGRSTNGQSFEDWIVQLEVCLDANPKKFSTLIGSKDTAISLCASAEYFAETNSSRVSYTSNFNSKYNSTFCSTIPRLPEERLSGEPTGDSRSASGTFNMYSTYVLLITMYQILGIN